MKNSTKQMNIILGLVLILVLAAVIYLKISSNTAIKYITETKASNFIASEKVNSIVGLKAKLEETNAVGKALDSIYIDRNNILDFIEKIESLADKNNLVLNIENVDVDKAHLNDTPIPYGTLKMTLNANGGIVAIGNFISGLEKMPYLISINAIRLANAGDKGGGWTVNIALEGITN